MWAQIPSVSPIFKGWKMKNIFYDKMSQLFPNLFDTTDNRNLVIDYGFQCCEGWNDLIFDTLIAINAVSTLIGISPKLLQVKEKFGTLTIYLDYSPFKEHKLHDSIWKMFSTITHIASEKSLSICEECGEEGELNKSNGWWKTVCSTCNIKG